MAKAITTVWMIIRYILIIIISFNDKLCLPLLVPSAWASKILISLSGKNIN
jgi:hypothetical protein